MTDMIIAMLAEAVNDYVQADWDGDYIARLENGVIEVYDITDHDARLQGLPGKKISSVSVIKNYRNSCGLDTLTMDWYGKTVTVCAENIGARFIVGLMNLMNGG